jgi:biopolymer transport protein TolQ
LFLAASRRYHGISVASLPVAFLLLQQFNFWDLVDPRKPIPFAVLLVLVLASVISWGIVFRKWSQMKRARDTNRQFLRAFRKAEGFEPIAVASEQFRGSPACGVFDYGYAEVVRQAKLRRTVYNKASLERCLQIGVSEEMSRLEDGTPWLATIAAVTPFIGLFGTVWGIIDAFRALTLSGAASLRAVGPGIADALVATAMGLFAAIPAAIFYNYFGHQLKEISTRLEDFALEFLNLTERTFSE